MYRSGTETKSRLRPRHFLAVTLLLSLGGALSISAAPSDASTPEVLKYIPGKTYQYRFESKSLTELTGTTAETSAVELNGDVALAVTNADFVLTLQNFKLVSPSGKVVQRLAELDGSSVRFSYSNGRISEFKVNENDPTWSANIKRAVASLFVNYAVVTPDIPRVQYLEDDVSGFNCPTDYVTSATGQFKKTRDLNRCSGRDGGFSTQFGVPFTSATSQTDTDIQSDATVDSDQTCNQAFDNGILKTTQCTETHRVTLLNNGDSGAKATVSSSLTFSRVQDGTPTASASTATHACTIRFVHTSSGLSRTNKALGTAEQLLQTLCTDVADGVLGDETAETYMSLKKNLKDVNEDGLQSLSGKVCNEKARKLFYDAVASTATPDSISFLVKLIREGKVSKGTERVFRIYTTFADKPTEKALLSLKSLIENKDVDPKFFFTASGLARQFYRKNRKTAASNAAYVGIANELAKRVQDNFQSANEDSQAVAVSALQALGNFEFLPTNAVSAIQSAISGNSRRIKVHALQAFRSDVCQASLRSKARGILQDKTVSSDLRIHAYLAYDKCATAESDAGFYNDLVREEDSLQVLAFLKSHLSNKPDPIIITKASNPLLAKTLSDARKFSQNVPYSIVDSDTTGIGYSTEANVIYAADSFLPKTVSANFTVDLYGESYNLLEVGLNLGDFDNVFEKLFGPKGEFPTYYDEKRKRGRGRRAIAPEIKQNELDVFYGQVKIDETSERDDVYVRVFGTTIAAKSFDLEDFLVEDGRYNFGDSIVNAVKGSADIDFTEPFPVFADELIIPTVSGLPLTVRADATALLALQVKNELTEDLKTYKPRIAPSASIKSKLSLTIGSEFFEAGFGVDTQVHSALDISAHGVLDSAQQGKFNYDLSISIPQEKLHLLDISNEIYWLEEFASEGPASKKAIVPTNPQKVTADNRCSQRLESYFGLKVCHTSKIPTGKDLPDFPINGPLDYSLTLANAEGSKDYKANLKFQLDRSGPYSFLVQVDTPGSSVNRKVEIKGVYQSSYGDKDISKLSVNFDSPVKKAYLSCDYENDFKDKKGAHTLKVGVDAREYSLATKWTSVDQTTKVNSVLSLPGQNPVEILNVEATQKKEGPTTSATWNVVAGPSNKPYVATSGTIGSTLRQDSNTPELSFNEVQLTCTGKRIFLLNGRVHNQLVDLDTKFLVGESEHDVKVNGELDIPEPGRVVFKGTVSSASLPFLNGALSLDRTSRNDHRKTSLQVNRDGVKLVNYEFLHKDQQYSEDVFVATPDGTTYEFKFDRVLEPEQYSLTYSLNLAKKVASNAEIKFNRKDHTYKLNGALTVPGTEIKLNSERAKSSKSGEPVESFVHGLALQPGPSFKLDTKVYVDRAKGGIWKRRVSVISSSLLDADRTLTINYDVSSENENRPKLTRDGSGTVELLVKKGQGDKAKFSLTTQIPKGPSDDGLAKLQVFLSGVVDSELTLNIAPGKTNVFDLNGDIEVYGAGTTASIKTSLVTDFHLSRDPVKSAQYMIELKCNDGKPSFKSFTYASDLKYQNDAQRFTYDSTRKITLTGSTYQIDTKVKVDKSPMGVHKVFLHILYPNQEKYNFDLLANTQSDPRTKFGHFELDIQLHKEPKSTLIFEAGLKNLNLNRNEFQFLVNYKLVREGVNSPKTKKGNHYPALEFVVDSQPRNGKHAVNINYSEGGVYVVTPIHYDIQAELGGGEYNLNYRGGQDDAPDTLLDVGVKKSVNELTTYTFTYVFDKSVVEGQDPDVKATLGYSYRYNSLTDFEYKESFDAQTYNAVAPENNSKATVARSMKVGANGIDFTSHMVLSKGNTAPSKDHDLKFSLNREDKKVTGSFELHDKGIGYLTKNPGQTDVSLSFEVSRDFPNLHMTITGKFPRYDNIKLKIDHENVNNGQVRNTTVDAKVGDFQLGFVSNLENSADRKTLDWTLNLNNDPPKKLTLVYTDAAKGPSIEAFVQWDNGQVLSSTGALEKLANGFNANFNFDSPTLANKWKLAVSRQADAQKESFRISAESPDTQEVLSVSYDKKASKKSGKLSLNANGKVKLNLRQKKVNANGGLEFLLDKQFYDEGRTTKGQRVKLQVAFQTDKRSGNLSLEAGQGDSAKQLNLQACSLPEDCVQLKAQLSQEKGKESYVGSVARGDDGAGVSLEVSTSDDSQTRSRSIRVYRTQDGRTRDVKIKLFKQPGEVADLDLVKDVVKVTPSTIAKRGLEVEMFGTTLTAIGTLATWESVDGYSLEGSCWLDKANQPTKKFALGFSKVGASVNEQGQGQDLTIAARHYLLQRDLKATVHYRYGITNKVFELTSEVDIFKQEQDKLVLSAELNQNRGSSGSPLFGIDLSAKSAGQGIVLSTSCNNIKVEESGVSFTCQVVGKASGTERKFIVDYDRTKETRTIEIKNTERYFFYNRSLTFEKTLDSLNPNRAYYSPTLNIEIQLPGMPDPRIITYRAGFPFTVSLKTNPSASNLNEFSELWLGTTGTNAFGFGLIRNSDSGRLSLVDVQLAKLKKQLSVTVDWNRENIIQFLHDRVSILNKNQDTLVKFVNEAFASAEDTSNAICDSFSKASQDFGPVKERFSNIVGSVGLGSSPVVGTNTDIVQTIATKVSVLAALRKAALAGIEGGYGGANTLASTVEGVVNQLSSVQSFPRADSTAKRVAAFRDTVQTIVKAIRQLVAQTKPLKEKYPLIQKLATKIRQTIVDKVKKAYKSAKNDLNELFPYSEVKKFLEDFVDYFETALLRPEEVTPAQKAQITGEMDKAVEQILVQAFAADFTKGHAVINVPLVYRAKLFKFDQDSDDPITEFLEKLSKSPRDALPPVDATGLILGTGHFVTFDGKMGRFDKTCNYLLASDFVGRNFSVALDLGSDGASSGSESLSVTDGKNTISLAFGKVYVDKKQYETYTVPTRVGSFKISQDAGWLIVSGDSGVKVGCQIHKAWEQDHMCAVQISGFYHGKVEGVLGHYDNEPKDDYKLPTGQITDYNALFVKSWKLNQECQGKNNWKDISEYYDNLYDKEELDFDTFFSKSSRSPHRKFSSSEGLYASASLTSGVSSVLTAMLLLISLLFGYLD